MKMKGYTVNRELLTVIETPPSPLWLLTTTFHPLFAILKTRCFRYCNKCHDHDQKIEPNSHIYIYAHMFEYTKVLIHDKRITKMS